MSKKLRHHPKDIHLYIYTLTSEIISQKAAKTPTQVYQAEVGATVIFSCIVDNIDGVRGEDWGVVYKVKEQNQEYKDVPVSLPAGFTSSLCCGLI